MGTLHMRGARTPSAFVFAAGVLPILLTTPVATGPSGATPGAEPVCIAIMAATVSGVEGSAIEAGAAVQDLFVSILAGPSMRPLALDARLRSQAVQEAAQKNCPNVLATSVTRKRGNGNSLGRIVGQAAGGAAWYIPGGSGAAAIARGVSAGAAHALSGIASSTRVKDEMTLEWTLSQPAAPGRAPVRRSEKLKASSDGEDLLSPLVQRAAEAIAELVQK